jgi:hypothetical protein
MGMKVKASRTDITVNLGKWKGKLINACKDDNITMTAVVKELVKNWVEAKEKEKQRFRKTEAEILKLEKEIAASSAAIESKPDQGFAGGKTVKGQSSK